MNRIDAIDAAIDADRKDPSGGPFVIFRIGDDYDFSDDPPDGSDFVAWVNGHNICTFDGRVSMRWTKVSDAYPAPGKKVMVYTHGTDFSGEQFFTVQSDWFYEVWDGEFSYEEIEAATHWAELPYPEDV